MAEAKDAASEAKEKAADQAGDRIRETAKWLIVTFGAVGGALITGLQLTGLSDVPEDDLTAAIAGFSLGIAGVVLAIMAAAGVLTAKRIVLDDLRGPETGTDEGPPFSTRRAVNRREDLRAGYPSVNALVDDVNSAIVKSTDAWRDLQDDPQNKVKETAFANASAKVTSLTQYANRLTRAATYEHLRLVWILARTFVVIGVILAAVGVALFAVKVSPEEADAEQALAEEPVPVNVVLTAQGKELYKDQLGATCNLEEVSAIALGATDDSIEVVTIPTYESACNSVRFTLKRGEGTVSSLNTVSVPDLEPEPSPLSTLPDLPD